MAEVAGVVASGITFAQLAGSAIKASLKLKELWDQIEGSHETIQDLIDQIECLGSALWDAEQTFNHPGLPAIVWHGAGAQSSARYCRKALQNLTEVVDNLAAQIGSAKRARKAVGKIKLIMKRKQLDELEAKMTRAVQMLQMAQTGYLIAQSRLQPDIIAAKVQSMIVTHTAQERPASGGRDNRASLVEDAQNTEEDLDSLQLQIHEQDCNALSPKDHFRHRKNLTRTREYSATIAPPFWLAGWMYAWSFTLRRSYSGWDANVRYYALRPSGSDCFGAALRGDLELLKMLLTTGKADPNDRCIENDKSLLHYAARGKNNVSVIKYLLDAGSKVEHVSEYGETPGHLYLTDTWHWDRSGTEEMQSFLQLKAAGLFSAIDIDSASDDDMAKHKCSCPFTVEASNFGAMQAVACPWHAQATVSSKIDRAWYCIFRDVRKSTITLTKQILSPEWETGRRLLCSSEGYGGLSLLHLAASLLTRIYVVIHRRGHLNRYERGECVREWASFASEILLHCQDLHSVAGQVLWRTKGYYHYGLRGTPLTYAVIICIQEHAWELPGVLRDWLLALKQAGVDLWEYGARENAVLSEVGGAGDIWPHRRLRDGLGGVPRLLSFKVGPEADDWDVFYMEPLHDYSSDFWAMVEGRPEGNEPLNVPGAWIEDDQ